MGEKLGGGGRGQFLTYHRLGDLNVRECVFFVLTKKQGKCFRKPFSSIKMANHRKFIEAIILHFVKQVGIVLKEDVPLAKRGCLRNIRKLGCQQFSELHGRRNLKNQTTLDSRKGDHTFIVQAGTFERNKGQSSR